MLMMCVQHDQLMAISLFYDHMLCSYWPCSKL